MANSASYQAGDLQVVIHFTVLALSCDCHAFYQTAIDAGSLAD
jgi:hypothetical protein